MAEVSVLEYIEGAIGSESLKRAQVKSAGTIVAQFLLVREGLTGRIKNEDLNSVAATLTAGIWANSDD